MEVEMTIDEMIELLLDPIPGVDYQIEEDDEVDDYPYDDEEIDDEDEDLEEIDEEYDEDDEDEKD